MAYIREETLDNFTDEELLELVKRNLEDLGIAYEERPGGFGDFLPLDPADVELWEEESYTLQSRPAGRSHYRVKPPVDYDCGLTIDEEGFTLAAPGLGMDQESEDGPVLAAA